MMRNESEMGDVIEDLVAVLVELGDAATRRRKGDGGDVARDRYRRGGRGPTPTRCWTRSGRPCCGAAEEHHEHAEQLRAYARTGDTEP